MRCTEGAPTPSLKSSVAQQRGCDRKPRGAKAKRPLGAGAGAEGRPAWKGLRAARLAAVLVARCYLGRRYRSQRRRRLTQRDVTRRSATRDEQRGAFGADDEHFGSALAPW